MFRTRYTLELTVKLKKKKKIYFEIITRTKNYMFFLKYNIDVYVKYVLK